MKIKRKLIRILLGLLLISSGCANRSSAETTAVRQPGADSSAAESQAKSTVSNVPASLDTPVGIAAPLTQRQKSSIFVENTNGTDDGIRKLFNSMQRQGIDLYKSEQLGFAVSPSGLIAADDVIIIKINCQWAERGGTNTDLIRSVIQMITNHPDGFKGEVIIADNGQAQYGSERRGGSLSWTNANSADRRQSVMDVVRFFKAGGFRVTGVLWDDFTTVKVQEFASGDTRNGFIVEDNVRSTGAEISYAKFTTEFGTHVSFKEGIWNASTRTYQSEKLKLINMPVLKSHALYQVTGAVKAYMGTPSDRLTNGRSHNAIARGWMGTQMANTRMPVINIMDMIWIGADRGPSSSYATAQQINKVAASIDPFALDYWASKNILMPVVSQLPGGRAPAMNPDSTTPGTFGYWMRLSMEEVHKEGIWATMNESEITVYDNSSI
ncbi:MAG: DUF362 domain-containing protein [Treponema sp.]|nr:DUF362 domain-containing protein [Treponema sp.]